LGQKIFGTKAAAWYAIWSVMSVPLLISWSCVNFGLHHLASFFPFVFAYVVLAFPSRNFYPWLCGGMAGLAIWFSYDSIILPVAFVIWLLMEPEFQQKRFMYLLKFLGALCIGVLPHLLLKFIPDNGFHLETLTASEIRGVGMSDVEWVRGFKHLVTVWIKPLPASFFLSAGGTVLSIIQRLLVMVFIFSGIYFCVKNWRQQSTNRFLAVVILLFLALYAFSPFYETSANSTSYVSYRHLNYSIPLLVMLLFNFFANTGKKGDYVLIAWISLGVLFTLLYGFTTRPLIHAEYRAAGWVLARKFGDDPEKLIRLNTMAPPEYRTELCTGFGWGITTTLLSNKTANAEVQLDRVKELIGKFPEPEKRSVMEGMKIAFAPGTTPVLDPALSEKLEYKLKH
jgi:hypothetical protein